MNFSIQNLKNIAISLLASCCLGQLQAAEPANYYASCEGKTGEALLKALSAVVGPHTNVGYDGLWEVYQKSDVRANGTLWDMYSTKEWPSNFTKCGNYKLVGDCVNREHSFPKSWWGGGKQVQYSDAYHLYPTDGKVNGQRSNYPFGECEGGSSLAANGSVKPLGRLGTSTFPGYTGKVFEPDDQYKGDFARSYFYLAAAYNDKIGGWSSDMLAGNSYPVYKTWAVNLLLKWCRQDPVSDKETKRNDAVSSFQKNRNPFIDHPELIEYIWGNKVGVAWYANAATDPQILLPADGTTINIGTSSAGVSRSHTLTVKGTALESNVSVSVSGTGFSASAASLAATAVNNDGAPLTITFLSNSAVDATGTLTLKSGDAVNTIALRARAVDGLPAGPATDITETSFIARWSCIDDPATRYTVNVMCNGVSLDEFPMSVAAADEQLLVSDLQPETAYTYTVASATLTSAPVEVTTLAPQPEISFLYDGELKFYAIPGEPSDIAEILAIIENIPGDVTITVKAPFQVSTDKADWNTSVVLLPGEDRFYMRLYGNREGEFHTSIVATAEDFHYDDVDVDGEISSSRTDFYEDFEPAASGGGNYNKKTYVGSACAWDTNALFETGTSNALPHEGEQAARTPKSAGYLTTLTGKPSGIGQLSLWARLWGNDTNPSVWDVKVSSDGENWTTVGEIRVERTGSSNTYAEYHLDINRTGNLRLKLEQTSGARTMIDDIRMTNYVSGVEEANLATYHSWDAFCRQGDLVIENLSGESRIVTVYSVDGITLFDGILPAAGLNLQAAPGLYIVVSDDFSRRVLVK